MYIYIYIKLKIAFRVVWICRFGAPPREFFYRGSQDKINKHRRFSISLLRGGGGFSPLLAAWAPPGGVWGEGELEGKPGIQGVRGPDPPHETVANTCDFPTKTHKSHRGRHAHIQGKRWGRLERTGRSRALGVGPALGSN